MIRRIVNGTEIKFYYDSSLDTVPSGIMQFYVHQSQRKYCHCISTRTNLLIATEFYMARVITTPESTINPSYPYGLDTATVIVDKCTSPLVCSMHLTQTQTIASTFVTNSTHWFFCGRAVILNNTNAFGAVSHPKMHYYCPLVTLFRTFTASAQMLRAHE